MYLKRINFKNIILVAIISFIVLIPVFSYAQEDIISTEGNFLALSQKVEALESINNKILNTVYWTLGVLAAVFLGLISVNLYFNISANKREFEKTREELLATVKNEIIASESRILEKIAKSNAQEFERIKKESLAATENGIIASESRILEKIAKSNAQEFERIKKELLTITKNEVISAKSLIIEKIARLETNTEQMKYNIDDLEMDLRELEQIRYAKEGKQGAITILIRLLNKAIERNYDFRITEYLFQIRDYVKETPIRSYVNIDLEKELIKLEKKTEFKTTIEEIRSIKKVVAD